MAAALAAHIESVAQNLGAVAPPPAFHVTDYTGNEGGGGLNQLMCPAESPLLVGVMVAVAHLDEDYGDERVGRLAPLCAAIDADHQWNLRDVAEPPNTRVGTVRSALAEARLLCDHGSYMLGIRGNTPGFLKDPPDVIERVTILCGSAGADGIVDISHFRDGRQMRHEYPRANRSIKQSLCPGNLVGRGLSVYSGVYIDRLALICGPMIITGLTPAERAAGPLDYPEGPTAEDIAKSAPVGDRAFKRVDRTADAAVGEKVAEPKSAAASAVIYALRNSVPEVLVYQHSGASAAEAGTWSASRLAARQLPGYAALIGAGREALYGATFGNQLRYWRANHLDRADADLSVSVPGLAPSDYRSVVASQSETLYAFRPDGGVDMFRGRIMLDGSRQWDGPRRVATGWPAFIRAFSGGDEVIYTIKQNGELLWTRQASEAASPVSYAGSAVVGTGWGRFTNVFSPGGGVIYAIEPNGDLLWYRFRGHERGLKGMGWEGPTKVGKGWQNFRSVIALPAK